MAEEYVDPEFPQLDSQPEEIYRDPEGNLEPEVLDEGFVEETIYPHDFEGLVDLGLVESSPDSDEVLFFPGDDPLRHPVIHELLDPPLVYTRYVSKRLRHLTCERRGPEYVKPSGLYRPGG